MKKLDLGQAIAITANLGVIAGIVFLAFELRQNREQLEIQYRGQMTAYRNTIPELALENPYIIEIQRKSTDDLSQSERDQLAVLGLRLLLNFEEQYRDVVLGRVDREEVIRAQRAIYHREWLSWGVPLAWNTLYQERASPGFIEWMNDYIVVE